MLIVFYLIQHIFRHYFIISGGVLTVITTIFYIPEMDCPEEINLIQNKLKTYPGIDKLEFNLIQQKLMVTHQQIKLEEIMRVLIGLGMTATIAKQDNTEEKSVAKGTTWKDWTIIAIAGACALTAEMIAFITREESSVIVIVLTLAAMLIGGREIFLKGLRAIRHVNLNMNFLMSIAIIGAIAIGEWPEAAMVAVLFALAELIERHALDSARQAIRGLMEMTPDTAHVQIDDTWQVQPVGSIREGAIVWVKPGERIPLDAVVVKGQSNVNQAPITGESMPVNKKIGDMVFAGTINERGSFECKVLTEPGDTLLAKMVRAVAQAQAERAPTQRFVDQFAKYYTPVMVLLAIAVATIPVLFFGESFVTWFNKALILLVIACPCALVISTPVTIVSGLTTAARHGVLIKGGTYLELGRKLRAIAFDKTGTLTYGKPTVTDVVAFAPYTQADVLGIAASLDAHSEHPIAIALVSYYKHNNNSALKNVDAFEALPGRGVMGLIDNNRYFVGNHRMAEEQGICNTEIEKVLQRLESAGKTTIIVATDKQVLGILAVADAVREDSAKMLKAVEDLGLKTVMLTGDNPQTANAIGQSLGMADIRANLLPEDKLTVMDRLLKQYQVVGMIGDGINDAPSLAKASIGFAMGTAGTDVALETADVALMDDKLSKIPFFIHLSKKTGRKLMQNITFSIAVKALFFVLALIGLATLWMAVFADIGASLIVVLNALGLMRYRERPSLRA